MFDITSEVINLELLPGSVLDDLGGVRIRRHVQLWLSYRIAGA